KGGYTPAPNVWSVSDGVGMSNWTTDSAGTVNTGLVPGIATDVFISAANEGTTGGQNQDNMVLGADMTIKSLTINAADTARPIMLQSTGNNTLTIAAAAAITDNVVGASAATFNNKIALSNAAPTISVANTT